MTRRGSSAYLPEVPASFKDGPLRTYLIELREAMLSELTSLQATQQEPYTVTGPAAPVRTIDAGAPDLGDTTDFVATLAIDLKAKGVI